jgi:hypothetical protein
MKLYTHIAYHSDMKTSIKVIRRTVFRNNCSRRLLYLYFDRYIFRPLSAIFRRNTQYIKKLLLLQRIRCILTNIAVVYLTVIARYVILNAITPFLILKC